MLLKINKIVCKMVPMETQCKTFENRRLGFIVSVHER